MTDPSLRSRVSGSRGLSPSGSANGQNQHCLNRQLTWMQRSFLHLFQLPWETRVLRTSQQYGEPPKILFMYLSLDYAGEMEDFYTLQSWTLHNFRSTHDSSMKLLSYDKLLSHCTLTDLLLWFYTHAYIVIYYGNSEKLFLQTCR